MQNITRLPQPSHKHATCAWCNQDFDTIVQLLDHVDNGHTDSVSTTSSRQLSEAA
jgi:hypothetical protein